MTSASKRTSRTASYDTFSATISWWAWMVTWILFANACSRSLETILAESRYPVPFMQKFQPRQNPFGIFFDLLENLLVIFLIFRQKQNRLTGFFQIRYFRGRLDNFPHRDQSVSARIAQVWFSSSSSLGGATRSSILNPLSILLAILFNEWRSSVDTSFFLSNGLKSLGMRDRCK
uniref:Uncharacterized protein n=1 Tax=Candidatus Kentrum sp. LFY TaxID=2126342 RepID=A0A450UI25_9GAMM|nr:MAG: hypothetical protein BECKLFY1418A_GA0070994_102127 [Candidatus Kentron sp. LFY]